MIPFIDVHCHLDYPDIYPRIEEVLNHSKEAGIKIIVTNGVDKKTNRICLELAKKHDVIKPALGFYPPDALHQELSANHKFQFDFNELKEELEFIKKHKNEIVAIGEVGMDYKNGHDKELQKKVFVTFINLANELDKPIIVHSRKAESDTIQILEENKARKVIMHCFSGNNSLIKKAASLGYYFSVPTNVVRAENMQGLVRLVPITQLFAETDSPFLSPFKDKINEPAFVVESYKKIAEIKGMTLEETKNSLYMNYQRLFF